MLTQDRSWIVIFYQAAFLLLLLALSVSNYSASPPTLLFPAASLFSGDPFYNMQFWTPEEFTPLPSLLSHLTTSYQHLQWTFFVALYPDKHYLLQIRYFNSPASICDDQGTTYTIKKKSSCTLCVPMFVIWIVCKHCTSFLLFFFCKQLLRKFFFKISFTIVSYRIAPCLSITK